jgi:UDP:flavonoid glycosyltransferase YjiC (YdhE family)
MGTDGDVFPYLALGARLSARGHRVTLVANQRYEDSATEHGFAFHTLISNNEENQLFSNPDFWHPVRGPLLGARVGAPLISRQCSLLAKLVGGRDTVFIASPGVFAASIVREKYSLRLATIICQPWLIPSAIAPPAMPGGLTLPGWAPLTLRRLYFRLIDTLGGMLVGRQVREARATLGLKPVRGVYSWWFSPELVVGLFPEWYAPPQADWPAQIQLASFPLYDGQPKGELSDELIRFCRAGDQPVVFTFGTGMLHAAQSFRVALESCVALGIRGILLTKHAEQVPSPLPETVRHIPFVPLRKLLPHCVAIVHHGGIGTVSQALAAGTPQLVLPLAWDQPDNAHRVKQLGVGDWLPRHRRNTAHVTDALRRVMSPAIRTRCAEVAEYFDGDDSLEAAVAHIERLALRNGAWHQF